MAMFCKRYQDSNMLHFLSEDLLLLSLEWPSSLSICKPTALTEAELEPLRTFSCRNARCFKPADRAFVLAAIRKDFGSEAAFDNFVRTTFPEVLRTSKVRYSTQLVRRAGETFELAFGG